MKRSIIRSTCLLLCILGSSLAVKGVEHEFRALWVDTFHPALRNSAEIKTLIEAARAGRFNTLFVEVRKRGDAYYESRFEPKAEDIAADFDPLAELIARARHPDPLLSLEVHAWMVAYPIWHRTDRKPLNAEHVFNRRPEWLTQNSQGGLWDGANYSLDPGHPEVQRHLFDVAMDLVANYEIDGLHLDYIRYAGRQWGYNPASVARFNARHNREGTPDTADPDWSQFRRDQVTALVRKIYLSAWAVKPQVRISAATICWTPAVVRTSQWQSSAAYSTVLQDWRAWMDEGILDLNVPMAYFRQTTHRDDWLRWNVFAKDHRYGRQVAMGTGFYLNSIANTLAQIPVSRETTRMGNRADGIAGFSYATSSADNGPFPGLASALTGAGGTEGDEPLFSERAAVPEMLWKLEPERGHLMGFVEDSGGNALDGAALTLTGPETRTLLTDATGFYGAVDLAPGRYLVKAKMKELAPEYFSIRIRKGKLSQAEPRLQSLRSHGIPPWWSRHYFGDTVDPAGDEDGDGYSNRSEYLLGTAPDDPESRLELNLRSRDQNTLELEISPILEEPEYELQMSEAAEDLDWKPVENVSIRFETNAHTAFLSFPRPQSAQAFFRLVQHR